MTTTLTAPPSRAGRKIRALGIGVIIVVGLYSAGWFYVASKFETVLGQYVNRADGGRANVTCDGMTASETANLFRFSLGMRCNRIVVADQQSGDRLTAGAFVALARIYNPGLVNIDLEGPANLTRGDGTRVEGQWQRLQSSLRASFGGLSEMSLKADLPVMTIDVPEFNLPFDLKMREGEWHSRQNNGDLDVAAIANDLEWTTGDGAAVLPKLSTSAELSLHGKAGVMSGERLDVRGMKGELKSFKIGTPEGLYGEMSGPFTIDQNGRVNGKFRTTFEKVSLWDSTLRTVFPDAGDTISGVAALLKGLSNGKDRVTVNLKVDRGHISLSFLPLGEIPAL